jgi:hypothetical protein
MALQYLKEVRQGELEWQPGMQLELEDWVNIEGLARGMEGKA